MSDDGNPGRFSYWHRKSPRNRNGLQLAYIHRVLRDRARAAFAAAAVEGAQGQPFARELCVLRRVESAVRASPLDIDRGRLVRGAGLGQVRASVAPACVDVAV